jgi:hypothetical protein
MPHYSSVLLMVLRTPVLPSPIVLAALGLRAKSR